MQLTRYQKYKSTYEAYRLTHKEEASQFHDKYNFNGNRSFVLERDYYKCVMCGMGDHKHLIQFGRRLTVDHINGDRNNNSLNNLQTLCLTCHGKKDTQRRKTPYNNYKALRKLDCDFCGNEFIRPLRELYTRIKAKQITFYCSHRCHMKAYWQIKKSK